MKDRGTILYGDVCKQGLDWRLIEQKAKKLARRGLVEVEDSYCWLTKQGWEWLEAQGVDTSNREEGW